MRIVIVLDLFVGHCYSRIRNCKITLHHIGYIGVLLRKIERCPGFQVIYNYCVGQQCDIFFFQSLRAYHLLDKQPERFILINQRLFLRTGAGHVDDIDKFNQRSAAKHACLWVKKEGELLQNR